MLFQTSYTTSQWHQMGLPCCPITTAPSTTFSSAWAGTQWPLNFPPLLLSVQNDYHYVRLLWIWLFKALHATIFLLYLVYFIECLTKLQCISECPLPPPLIESYQVGLALSVFLLPPATSVEIAGMCPHKWNVVPFKVQTISCCIHHIGLCLTWFSVCFWPFVWFWDLNPWSHTS